jgi:hypothetical protein
VHELSPRLISFEPMPQPESALDRRRELEIEVEKLRGVIGKKDEEMKMIKDEHDRYVFLLSLLSKVWLDSHELIDFFRIFTLTEKKRKRMRENANLFDFELSQHDMNEISKLGENVDRDEGRICWRTEPLRLLDFD